MDFKNKNAIVTGGSRGIGSAIAIALAEKGSNVIFTYAHNDDEAGKTLDKIRSNGVDGYSYKINQENMDEISKFMEFVKLKFNTVDILINNAGICPFRNYFDIDKPLFEKVWKINVESHFFITQEISKIMMHSLAIILGKYGIMVNSLEPGTILTDINRDDLSDDKKRKYMESRIPLGRLGKPEDMAGPALFLVSDENTYVNGSELLADGGMLVNLQ